MTDTPLAGCGAGKHLGANVPLQAYDSTGHELMRCAGVLEIHRVYRGWELSWKSPKG